MSLKSYNKQVGNVMTPKEKILIVDDDSVNLHHLESILSGYNVLSASSPSAMWNILEEEIPDVILLDVIMSGEDGFQIAGRLSGEPHLQDIPIIFISAKDSGKDVADGFEAGGQDYIKKPFESDEVKVRLKSILVRNRERLLLLEHSRLDTLTGIYNRRYFSQRFDEMLAFVRREEIEISVAMLDIDFFKEVNDRHGHQAGDFILRNFAKKLKAEVRPYDICARYGGEEFIYIFLKTLKANAVDIVRRLKEEISGKAYEYREISINVTFSCGISDVSDLPRDELSAEDLIKIADERLYRAKQAGRNRIVAE